MKIKPDENLPASLVASLSSLDHDIHTVAEENLSGSSDHVLWEPTQRDSLIPNSAADELVIWAIKKGTTEAVPQNSRSIRVHPRESAAMKSSLSPHP
jgi:hypothetical protein